MLISCKYTFRETASIMFDHIPRHHDPAHPYIKTTITIRIAQADKQRGSQKL